MLRALYLLFVVSGAAGLIYESIWTRYLGLFVGHDAYAQIIVLVIFLGGMSVGAIAISRWSTKLKEPLYGYVAVEFMVGCIGLVFHDVFQATTAWAYQGLFPTLAGSWALTAAKWGLASLLILPQSILLGMTFPLMSAGVLRLRSGAPGRTLSLLYFSNSLGAAAGVLVAGFYLVGLAGLPGTLLTAAILNLLVAVGTIGVVVAARNARIDGRLAPQSAQPPTPAAGLSGLERLLLFTSFGTAVASFIYEIDWIRMLALVLGSATHSFELMLSAFILGLALGAYWIRSRADQIQNPLRTLGLVQWVMGFLALATLPLYLLSFEWIAILLSTFARNDAGYLGFTIARYALCLAIMLPATFCAGMTLPLITRTLLIGGSGERAIGAVYAWNTLGSIVGASVGGLILLPLVGLKPMLIAGAAIDMGLGILLVSRSGGLVVWRRRLVLVGSVAAVLFAGLTAAGVRLDANLLASGVYRHGTLREGDGRDVTFYRDGRTATVTVTFTKATGMMALATNGKPDASLGKEWYQQCDSLSSPSTLGSDASTQTLLPLVALAHAPRAQTAAMIGQGSGMSSHMLLGSSALKELVTIEIEPQMVEGSRMFYPANRRTFDDPRSTIVIDDAKSYFASEHRRYDLIVSEPSNPWVSGVSGLFTTEFYSRIREYLNEDGIFGQWLHIYELDDGLVLSVLAALHQNFPSYEVFLVGQGDLLVVASKRPRLPVPDWSVLRSKAVQDDLCRFRPLTPDALSALHLIGRSELAPLLDSFGQPNSDYYPVLDLGAERRRFRNDFASLPRLSADWFNLLASFTGRRTGPGGDAKVALPEIPRVAARAIGAHVRLPAAKDPDDTTFSVLSRGAVFQWRNWQALSTAGRAPGNWEFWLEHAKLVDRVRNGGTAGTGDEELYSYLVRYMDRHGAPQIVRDVVAFRHGVASWDFAEASEAAERLVPVATKDERWIPADELRDGLVFAKLHLKDAAGARKAFDTLAPFSKRPTADLRTQLLASYVSTAERLQPAVAQR